MPGSVHLLNDRGGKNRRLRRISARVSHSTRRHRRTTLPFWINV
jgi:hypothetical protein